MFGRTRLGGRWPAVAALAILAGSLTVAAAARQVDSKFFEGLSYRNVGPARGGRSVAVTGVDSDPMTYYFGGTGGGVWKSDDGGNTWRPVSDGQIATGSVGSIAVASSDPNVVYVGMGEGCPRGNVSHGDGVYRSVDAGKTWTHIGLPDSRHVPRIRIHPRNPDLVYAAAMGHLYGPNEERGVYRSKDGGETWERVLFVDENTGAVDLAMDATNPRILYAAFWQVRRTPYSLESGGEGSGIYKTTDSGDTWTELTEGLPSGIKGRIGVAVSPVNPERVWAIVEAEDGGIFRSEDGGDSFTLINDDRNWRQRAWYYTHIYADTRNANRVYVLNTALAVSDDGGATFTSISVPHGDNHDLWIAPDDSGRLINGNDGGANVSFNGGRSWTRQDGQPTAQFYRVITDRQHPYRIYGAQQDNSTASVSSDATAAQRPDFFPVGGGESGHIAIDPRDTDIVYAGSYDGLLTRTDVRTGLSRNITVWPDNPMGHGAIDFKYRFQWNFPIVLSPHDPGTLYATSQHVHKSTNEGQSWEIISPDLTTNTPDRMQESGGPITKDDTSVEYYCTIFAFDESPLEAGVLWAGSDDGLVHISRNGGRTWTNVTPADMPRWGMVNSIDPSPHDPGAAYIAVTRYKSDDFAPYLFKISDYGARSESIVDGIDAGDFTRVIRADPGREGLLYAGTETGMWVSFDDGENWQAFQLNLPDTPVTDLRVFRDDLIVATQGRAFWVIDDLTPLHELTGAVMRSGAHLFAPRATIRTGGGVEVHYYLAEEAEDVTVEFLDAAGASIQTFESGAPGEAGMNRYSWNLRHPGASDVPGSVLWSGNLNGPLAVPGTYTVKVTAGGREMSQTFEVTKDPRSSATQADLEAQFDLLVEIRDKVTEVHDAVNTLRGVRAQVEDVMSKVGDLDPAGRVAEAGEALKEGMRAIEIELLQVKSQSGQDPLNYPIKVNNKIAALNGVVARGEWRPTDQSREVFAALAGGADALLAPLYAIFETQVPEFNDLVAELRIPAVTVKTGGGSGRR